MELDFRPDEYVGKCQVCDDRQIEVVDAIPGIPITVGRCEPCAQARAYPYGILVASAVDLGEDEGADWWQTMVMHTLAHLGKDRTDFSIDVNTLRAAITIAEVQADAEFAATDEGAEQCWSLVVPDQMGGAV
jgi:hypothetical protein